MSSSSGKIVSDNFVDVDTFARQLITDKCSALIESADLLPANILDIVKKARDKYFQEPTQKNYEYIKKLFLRTKYMDDSIDYKDFNRRILLIVFKFALNKSKNYFPSYKEIIEVAVKRLNKINPDLKSSPRAMLQHYNECLENLDNPITDEHHLVTFGKEVATKIFIEAFEYSYTNTNAIDMAKSDDSAFDFTTTNSTKNIFAITAPPTTSASTNLLTNVMNERKRKMENIGATSIALPSRPIVHASLSSSSSSSLLSNKKRIAAANKMQQHTSAKNKKPNMVQPLFLL
ncbi:ORF_41 [Catopsilia pomona nucleopolyhedrovirus]|uniref:ORF_41 n=1 Tax=Catopsilia pomona nucleopolyhedrovirus TaxID=1850906 RepID=A0A172WZB2_9ABAC|nr:ORF_41 [Catopsilia pomona nucleopolyhedrovirus]ANF29689.1 ORF_41 [Catopsilia pomona nucleopolyhedrovirus]